MESGIAQRAIQPHRQTPPRSLGATVAAAAAGSVGSTIGSSLAVRGQRLIQKFRESKI